MKFNLIFLSLISVACSGGELSMYKKAEINTMITAGQFDEAFKELEGAEIDSFWGGKLLENVSRQREMTTSGYLPQHKPVCEEKILKLVIAGSVQPSSSAIYNLTVAPCPEIAKEAINKADKENLEQGAARVHQFIKEVIAEQNKLSTGELDKDKANELKILGEIAPILTLLKEKLAAVCPVKCEEVGLLGRAVDNIASLSDQRKFYATKEGKNAIVKDAVCSNYKEDRRLRALIKDEKNKSKLSGYENVYKLKTWGDELHDVDVQLNEALVNYKQVTKKEFGKFSTCGE